jgi:two-component system response regulator DesR
VALLDIEMPGGDGLSVAARLRQELPEVKVMILTAFGRPGFLHRALEVGAAGYLLKDRPATELASAVRRVLAGETVVDPGLALGAMSMGANPLTAREVEVLAQARDLATIADIAGALHLSVGTVKNHLSVIIAKLGAHNRVDAVRTAQERSWLRLAPSTKGRRLNDNPPARSTVGPRSVIRRAPRPAERSDERSSWMEGKRKVCHHHAG